MKVAIFGMGYVGVVTAACLARAGHEVMGVDVDPAKVAGIAAGRSPIIEAGVPEALAEAVAAGRLQATADAWHATTWADAALVCVGTPSTDGGGVDLRYVEAVVADIGAAAAADGQPLTLIVRSTSLPGTLHRLVGELDRRHPDLVLHPAFNPEFLREGTAMADFDRPPFTIIGTDDEQAERVLRELYSGVEGEVHVTAPEVAETIKYASNAWHATKICFANEIGRLAKSSGIDSRDVMQILVRDQKLNVSPAYMRPGFAYGGSCLPKDVAGLLAIGRERNVDLPLLSSLPLSNRSQIEAGVEAVLATGARRVTLIGLAFKPGTDDLRESPMVHLVKRLLGEGCEVRIYDPAVNQARLFGTNLEFLRRHLRHFERLLEPDLAFALDGAEAVVLGHASEETHQVINLIDDAQVVIDLSGAVDKRRTEAGYVGIAW